MPQPYQRHKFRYSRLDLRAIKGELICIHMFWCSMANVAQIASPLKIA